MNQVPGDENRDWVFSVSKINKTGERWEVYKRPIPTEGNRRQFGDLYDFCVVNVTCTRK